MDTMYLVDLVQGISRLSSVAVNSPMMSLDLFEKW
jgi:hypothetical protein